MLTIKTSCISHVLLLKLKCDVIGTFKGTSLRWLFVLDTEPVVKLNGIRQPISIEYKMVHGLNQAVFRTYNF